MRSDKQVINNLKKIEYDLRYNLCSMQILNKDSNQFDYTTNNKLSDIINNIESTLKKINKIVFQTK